MASKASKVASEIQHEVMESIREVQHSAAPLSHQVELVEDSLHTGNVEAVSQAVVSGVASISKIVSGVVDGVSSHVVSISHKTGDVVDSEFPVMEVMVVLVIVAVAVVGVMFWKKMLCFAPTEPTIDNSKALADQAKIDEQADVVAKAEAEAKAAREKANLPTGTDAESQKAKDLERQQAEKAEADLLLANQRLEQMKAAFKKENLMAGTNTKLVENLSTFKEFSTPERSLPATNPQMMNILQSNSGGGFADIVNTIVAEVGQEHALDLVTDVFVKIEPMVDFQKFLAVKPLLPASILTDLSVVDLKTFLEKIPTDAELKSTVLTPEEFKARFKTIMKIIISAQVTVASADAIRSQSKSWFKMIGGNVADPKNLKILRLFAASTYDALAWNKHSWSAWYFIDDAAKTTPANILVMAADVQSALEHMNNEDATIKKAIDDLKAAVSTVAKTKAPTPKAWIKAVTQIRSVVVQIAIHVKTHIFTAHKAEQKKAVVKPAEVVAAPVKA